MPTYLKMKPSPCPACGFEDDSVTVVGETLAPPEPGELAICGKCGELLEYSSTLRLLPACAGTLELLSKEELEKVLFLQCAVRMAEVRTECHKLNVMQVAYSAEFAKS